MLAVTTEQIDQAVEALKKGEIIVFPTETSYGIGCDATNESAVAKIFRIKGRERIKALPVVIASKERVKDYIELSPVVEELIELFWPGPLNIIAPSNPNSPISSLCAQDDSQSVRVSSHPFTATLVRRFEKPSVATSANLADEPSLYSVSDIKEALAGSDDKPDVFIDGGNLPKLPSSTTVRIVNGRVEVLRQGIVEIPERFL